MKIENSAAKEGDMMTCFSPSEYCSPNTPDTTTCWPNAVTSRKRRPPWWGSFVAHVLPPSVDFRISAPAPLASAGLRKDEK